ncbi:MAG: hypothetical protein ACRDE9_04730 [Candidatus Limnocylindria bacterium]
MPQEAITGAFFVVAGLVMVIFRGAAANYLFAMYPVSMRPEREALRWMVVLGGVLALAVGGSVLLKLR